MFKVFGLMLVLASSFLPSVSLALVPSAEQLQMLQGMSESEKQSIAGQLGTGSVPEVSQKPEKVVETVKPIVVAAEPVDSASLKPFGSFLFAGQPTTFAPVNDIPVPTDYILGPGDQLKVHLFGSKNESYELVIDRNGQVSMPSLGPLTLSGMDFSEAKVFLTNKLKSLGVGVNVSITMGALRSFRIFVLGESRTPGSYLVSGMATMTHALYVSGGLTDIASYRHIQLKRQGRLIKTLDLYDLLLKGDTSSDKRLQPGDTVFIPKLAKQVSVSGEVLKPALYEIKNEKTLEELITLAGGLKSNAYAKSVQLSRITTAETRQTFSLDLSQNAGAKYPIKTGDHVVIPEVTASMNRLVKVSGEVSHKGLLAWQPGLKLLDLLPNRRYFTNDADLSLLFIKRQTKIAGHYELLKANWLLANEQPASLENIDLLPRDEVIILSSNAPEARRTQIDALLALIKPQATSLNPNKEVSVRGVVKYPGLYPLVKEMHVSDLLQMCGTLTPSAMLNEAEIIRYAVVNGERREVETIVVNLTKVLAGDIQHNVLLQPYDSLTVKQVSEWSDASETVVIKGEVAYPGAYVIKPGDTLESVLLRAGGFTQWAAPQNTVFTRSALKSQERREMDAMADELEKGLLFSLKTQAGGERDSASIATLGQSLVAKVKATPALGRLVIGLDPADETRYQTSLQLELRDGDELIVPKRSNEILVMGEVSRPASLLYQAGLTVEDYLQQSGGVTKRSDANSIYLVRGDGSIIKYESGFFSNGSDINIRPGDAIIVPMDVERVSPIVTWTSVTKILSNLAVTAATMKTLGVIN
jgi:polysaccharide export outer membrane protein